jgi:hypothetical protein
VDERVQTLYEWLKQIDLEEYLPKFQEHGAAKITHLLDIESEDLDKIGLKALEKKRFNKKREQLCMKNCRAQEESREENTIMTTATNICFPMPSTSMGKSVIVPEDQLKKEYSDLYFVSPQSQKQKTINSFILGMCAAARWRFKSKRALLDWARGERDSRWTLSLTLMSEEDMEDEKAYFREQSVLCRVAKLSKDFPDVWLMLDEDEPNIHRNKLDRVTAFSVEMERLAKWIQSVKENIEERIKGVKGKEGRKEEENFWLKLAKKATKVIQSVMALHEKTKKLKDKFDCLGKESMDERLKRT